MKLLTLSMLLRAEGAPAAKAAIQEVATSTERLGTVTTRGATADRAAASAKQANAQANRALAATSNAAAGATGNLVANFNDLFMMIGAGQNPLTTAIQQGTQITQVIGPMGAAGAVRSLGSAFMAMLSPINLITLGAIAAGSAMLQWLMSADEEADAVTAALERQRAALEAVVAETEKLRLERGMLMSGAQSTDEQIVLEEINRLLRERRAIAAELEAQQSSMGRAAGIGAQTVADAKQKELQAQLADLDAKIAALEKQRELNAATENGRAIAEQLKTSTQGITTAIQSADGSRLVGAFAAAFPTANALLSIAQGIVETIGGAAELQAQASGDRYDRFIGVVGQSSGPDAVRTRQFGGGAFRAPVRGAGLPAPRIPGGGGGGGGGAAARDEANALQELIESLEGEIEALRVQDPIQQELLKHREAMTGATEAEKQKVEELIAVREREAAALEGAKARREFFEDLGNNALEALIVKGESFNDVLKNIAQSLIQAGIQAALFGTGPFGDLFGGTSLMSMIFPGLGGKADGGIIHGPGTGRSDSILTRLSNGEFVVNAKATARNRHLLEAINAGALPGYARGGMVGADARRVGELGGSGLPGSIYMDFRGVQGDREIDVIARRAAAQMVALYDKEGLPVSVKRVSGDPRRTG